MNTKLIIAGAIACIGVGLLIGELFHKPSVVTKVEYKQGKTDTLYVEKRVEVRVPYAVARIETVLVDTSKQYVAAVDTSITQGDSIRADLRVRYHFPPQNYFDIRAGITSRSTNTHRTDTLLITQKPKEGFFDRFGVGIGYGFTLQGDQFVLRPSVGAYFRIYP